jgi:hypothetical protein
MLKTIMRIFSYLYHLVLVLFLLAVGAIAMFSANKTLQMPVLPWRDPELTYWLFFGSLVGLISLALAVTGKFRLLFRLWTVAVLGLMVYGFFVSGYYLGDFFRYAVLLTLGALIAALGSWTRIKRKRA